MRVKLKLNIIWLETKLGLAVNQIQSDKQIPLTQYYFWPKTDVWDQIKTELNTKPWILETEKISLLNSTAELMNQWQNYANQKIAYSKTTNQN